MPDFSLLSGLLFVLGSAFLGGIAAKKLHQPLIVGYLLSGLLFSVLLGNFGLKRESLSLLAEIGFALLMFTLGLEFSFTKIQKVKGTAVSGAMVQIILTIFLGTLLLINFFGLSFRSSFIIASAFSLSSTAIVVKLLTEKNRLESLSGEIMVGWLLIQDLAVLPLLSLLPVLFGSAGLSANLSGIFKAALLLAVTWYMARKIVPKLANRVILTQSRELLIIFAVIIVFSFAFFTSSFGFSFALGAFLAGLVLSHSEAHLAVFSEIRPFRDLFLSIFFVSLGLSLEPGFLVSNLGTIITLGFIFLLLKLVIVGGFLLIKGFHAKIIFEGAFGLAEIGEFSFVLAATALSLRFISRPEYGLVISVALLTMVTTPWLFSLSETAYRKSYHRLARFPRWHKRLFKGYHETLLAGEASTENHVVLLGYGRVGRWVGKALERAKVPYLIVEYDPYIFKDLRLREKKVIFGDPADIAVLDFAQVDKAKLVVIAIPDSLTQKIIITNCRVLNKNVPIICRSHLEEDASELKSLGAEHIIQPEFEAALSIIHRSLQHFGLGSQAIGREIKEIRKEHQ